MVNQNLIRNGLFYIGLSWQQTESHFALANTDSYFFGWNLHGNESPHSVLYMAATHAMVPALPCELAGVARLGVVCLNATDGDYPFDVVNITANSAFLYQAIPLASLPDKGTVVVTWWAAIPHNANCSKPGSYMHSIQFSTALDGGDYADDGVPDDEILILPETAWQQLRREFKIEHPEKQHYLSFKGDKNGGLCGVLITGVTLAYKTTAVTRITLVSPPADQSIPAGGTSKQLVFTVTSENNTPLDNVLVEFNLGDDAKALGVQFVGAVLVYRAHTVAGKLILPAGVIVASREASVGAFTLKAKVQGTEFPFTLQVIPDVTDAEFSLVRVEPPQPVAINHKFDGPIRVIVHQLVNGANQAAADGTQVTMSIIDEHSVNTPSFKDSPQGESQWEITVPTKNGSAHSINLYAGNVPGRYTVKVVLKDHPTRFLNYPVEVSGIDTFMPPHIDGEAVTCNTTLEGHWRFTTKWKGNLARDQPVVFDLLDNDDTGTRFVEKNLVSMTVPTGTDGVVAVPAIKVGRKTGKVMIEASGPGGDPTATVTLHVKCAPNPVHLG